MMRENQSDLVQPKRATLLTSTAQRATIIMPLVLLLLIASLAFRIQVAKASTYSCPLGNLCHGIILWPGTVTGGQTEDTVVSMGCPAPNCNPNGSALPHIGNVLWVLDRNNHQLNCVYVACWIETGYHTITGNHANGCTYDASWYYWADVRPGDSGLNVHCLGAVQSGDLGKNAWLYIASNGGGNWTIQVAPYTSYFSGTSRNNNMSADTIEIGMELEGTSGAYAYRGYFTYNAWQNGINGQWNPQTNSGTWHNDSPISSYWQTPPDPNGNNNGGSFSTGCSC
jgi:hypothetical protein